LQVYELSIHYEYTGELKSELLAAVEGLLLLQITARVKALVLKLMIKGKLQKLNPQTVAYLTTRSLFSTFQTYSPEEVNNHLK
jgi:hypothetical protein